MKKPVSLILILASLLTLLVGCIPNEPENDTAKLVVGALNGPTGMGMASLIYDAKADENTQYVIKNYASPDAAIPELTNGTLDMLCLPTNTAATLSGKLDISVIAINTLGSLYLLAKNGGELGSISDLDGKTVYASVPNSTTGPILSFIFDSLDIDVAIEYEPDHDALVAKVVAGAYDYVVLPEPKVSAALTKTTDYSVRFNISEEWDKVSDEPLAMGCIVVRNEYLEAHPMVVDKFLKDYKASIEYINTPANIDSSVAMITDAGIIPATGLAKKALSNLYGSIAYIDGEYMKATLTAFYNAIGQAMPGESFYYVK